MCAFCILALRWWRSITGSRLVTRRTLPPRSYPPFVGDGISKTRSRGEFVGYQNSRCQSLTEMAGSMIDKARRQIRTTTGAGQAKAQARQGTIRIPGNA